MVLPKSRLDGLGGLAHAAEIGGSVAGPVERQQCDDTFGGVGAGADLGTLMKRLLALKERVTR